MSLSLHAQTTSAIQFWDTTGTAATAKIGWSGTAASGKVFVSTPVDGEVVKVENGNMTVNGSVTATSVNGSGAGLTNIALSSHVHPEIGTLQTGLQGKSDLTHTHALYYSTQKVDSLVGTRAATTHTHSGSAITSGLVDTAYIKNGQYMINSAGSTGQVWKSDGVGIGYWGTDESGVGGTAGVSSIAATSPLTASAATGAVTLSLAGGGIGSSLLADSSVTGAKIANLAVQSSQLSATGSSSGQVLTSTGTSVTWQPTLSLAGTGSATTASKSDHSHTAYQAADADLTDLADGSLSGSKVGTGIDASNITTGSLDGSLVSTDFGSKEINLQYSGMVSFDEDPSDVEKFRIFPGSHTNGPRLYFARYFASTGSNHAIAYMSSAGTDAATVNIYGALTAINCCTASDLRLKQDVQPITDALDKVVGLRGVSYRWRTDAFPERGLPEGEEIGLIAQEVEQVAPGVVRTDPDGYKSVEYGKLTALLIEAVKEQQQQLEDYKARIERLEAQLSRTSSN